VARRRADPPAVLVRSGAPVRRRPASRARSRRRRWSRGRGSDGRSRVVRRHGADRRENRLDSDTVRLYGDSPSSRRDRRRARHNSQGRSSPWNGRSERRRRPPRPIHLLRCTDLERRARLRRSTDAAPAASHAGDCSRKALERCDWHDSRRPCIARGSCSGREHGAGAGLAPGLDIAARALASAAAACAAGSAGRHTFAAGGGFGLIRAGHSPSPRLGSPDAPGERHGSRSEEGDDRRVGEREKPCRGWAAARPRHRSARGGGCRVTRRHGSAIAPAGRRGSCSCRFPARPLRRPAKKAARHAPYHGER
jgi:hypothetical protein